MDVLKLFNREISFSVKMIILASLLITLTTTDLIVKEVVAKNLKNSGQVSVIANFWYLGYTENHDLGLSISRALTKNLDKHAKYLLMISLQGIACIIAVMLFMKLKQVKYLIPLALIICGGFGNCIDRVIRGFVVDYIVWYFKWIPMNFFNPLLLEAMSVGTAVAACKGGVDDLIIDGVTATVFERNDELGIYGCLRQLFDKREWAQQIARSAQQYLRENYSVSKMISSVMRIYSEVQK